jgi:hypothetical protein
VHRSVACDTGIVHQHLDRSEGSFDRFNTLGAGSEISDIEFEDGNASLFVEPVGRYIVAALIGGKDVASTFEPYRDRAANAAGSTRDHRHSTHALLPSFDCA